MAQHPLSFEDVQKKFSAATGIVIEDTPEHPLQKKADQLTLHLFKAINIATHTFRLAQIAEATRRCTGIYGAHTDTYTTLKPTAAELIGKLHAVMKTEQDNKFESITAWFSDMQAKHNAALPTSKMLRSCPRNKSETQLHAICVTYLPPNAHKPPRASVSILQSFLSQIESPTCRKIVMTIAVSGPRASHRMCFKITKSPDNKSTVVTLMDSNGDDGLTASTNRYYHAQMALGCLALLFPADNSWTLAGSPLYTCQKRSTLAKSCIAWSAIALDLSTMLEETTPFTDEEHLRALSSGTPQQLDNFVRSYMSARIRRVLWFVTPLDYNFATHTLTHNGKPIANMVALSSGVRVDKSAIFIDEFALTSNNRKNAPMAHSLRGPPPSRAKAILEWCSWVVAVFRHNRSVAFTQAASTSPTLDVYIAGLEAHHPTTSTDAQPVADAPPPKKQRTLQTPTAGMYALHL